MTMRRQEIINDKAIAGRPRVATLGKGLVARVRPSLIRTHKPRMLIAGAVLRESRGTIESHSEA